MKSLIDELGFVFQFQYISSTLQSEYQGRQSSFMEAVQI